MSPVYVGFKEVCASDKEPLEEIKGSRPRRRKAEVKIDWMMSMDVVGLLECLAGESSCGGALGLKLLDFLTCQLDRELILTIRSCLVIRREWMTSFKRVVSC